MRMSLVPDSWRLSGRCDAGLPTVVGFPAAALTWDPMSSSFEVLQSRERLRVGQSFLRMRPRIAGVAALGNAALLATSAAPET